MLFPWLLPPPVSQLHEITDNVLLNMAILGPETESEEFHFLIFTSKWRLHLSEKCALIEQGNGKSSASLKDYQLNVNHITEVFFPPTRSNTEFRLPSYLCNTHNICSLYKESVPDINEFLCLSIRKKLTLPQKNPRGLWIQESLMNLLKTNKILPTLQKTTFLIGTNEEKDQFSVFIRLKKKIQTWK